MPRVPFYRKSTGPTVTSGVKQETRAVAKERLSLDWLVALPEAEAVPSVKPAPVVAERRRSDRPRTALECRLVSGWLREQRHGTIRDIHEGGARIRVYGRPDHVLDPVEVSIADRSYRASVAWRSEREIGLRFLSSPDGGDEQIAALQAILGEMRLR